MFCQIVAWPMTWLRNAFIFFFVCRMLVWVWECVRLYSFVPRRSGTWKRKQYNESRLPVMRYASKFLFSFICIKFGFIWRTHHAIYVWFYIDNEHCVEKKDIMSQFSLVSFCHFLFFYFLPFYFLFLFSFLFICN